MMDFVIKMGELAERLRNMEQLTRLTQIFFLAVLIVGLMNCFLGYRLLRFWVMLVGFATGGLTGAALANSMDLDKMLILGAALAGALLLAAIAFFIYKAGIFILCAGIGWALSIYGIHPTTSLTFFICLLLGVGLGVLGVHFAKPIIIGGTAIQGGAFAGIAAAHLLGMEEIPYGLLIGLAFAALGILVQAASNREPQEDEEEEETSVPRSGREERRDREEDGRRTERKRQTKGRR